jgi:hypothetical protein
MLHHNVERELLHLERILPQMGSGPFPTSYWQARVDALAPGCKGAQFRIRLERLQQRLAQADSVTPSIAAAA